MALHSSTLAWKIPWTEEPGRLQSMGSLRVGRNFTFTFTFHFHALEKEMANHSRILAWRIPGTGEPGWAAVYGVAQNWTRLKRLSSSSSSSRWTFVDKVMSLLFNMLSRLVITFLPRSKCLLISWLQSPSDMILDPRKIKSATVSHIFAMK